MIKSGAGETNPLRLKIYVPFSSEPLKPLFIIVKNEASVEEVIGYSLYEFIKEERQPEIQEDKLSVVFWNMRIVEDDGSIDEDFPGMIFLF